MQTEIIGLNQMKSLLLEPFLSPSLSSSFPSCHHFNGSTTSLPRRDSLRIARFLFRSSKFSLRIRSTSDKEASLSLGNVESSHSDSSVDVFGIGSRKDAVFGFCLNSPSLSSSIRFWNIKTNDSMGLELEQRLFETDEAPRIFEDPFPWRSFSKAVVLVVTAGYGSDQTAIVDLFKTSRSSDRLAVGIFVKPFGFEGQKRQKEVQDLLNKLQKVLNFHIVIDTDALLKKDMVTLDEALKSANNAVLSAVNAIYVLTTKFHNKLLDVPHMSSRQYKVHDVVEILEGYKEAKIGFGAGCSIKSSIVKAIYDCPFLDVSLKNLNGIVLCILASSGVIENNDVHAFLSTFRQITECTTEILMSTIHERTLEPEVLVTTVIIIGSVKEQSLQQTGVLSRLAQHFPFVFKFLTRQHSETDDSHEGHAPAIPHLPEAQQLSDNIEMPTRTTSDGFAEVSGTYCKVLEMPPSSSYEEFHASSREYENAHQKSEGGPLKVDASSPYSHDQNSRGLAFPREPLTGWNSRPEYPIAEDSVEEKSTDFRDTPMLDNIRIYCLPVGVQLADESNDGLESSSMMHDQDPKITAIQNMYCWDELAEEGNEAVAHIHKTASTVLKEKYTDATKKQGGLSERAASMLEAERNSQKKWSPIVEMQYRGGVYRGRCQGGLPEGKGCLSLGDGSMYDGAWRYGKRSGIGTFYFSNGDVFQGSWRDDVMHGKGWFYFHTGDRWFASFWKGKANGEGRFYSKSGDVFFGHFQDGWRHGHFLRINVKGERFAEDWEEGRLVSCKQLDPEICDQDM